MRARARYWVAVAVVVAVGLVVRGWQLSAAPLWLDEAYSAYAADHDWAFLWRVVPLYETHPPFYYSLLHLWVGLWGDSVLALRLLGFAASVATLPLVWLMADQAGRWIGWDDRARRRLALLFLGLTCVSLALVEMAREVRPYPVMILAYAGAILLQLRMARRVGNGQPVSGWGYVAYLIAVEAMLWLHNLGPLYGVALTLALAVALLRHNLARRDWVWLVAGHLLVALLYLPGLAILIEQATTWTAKTWLDFRLDRLLVDRIMTLYGVPGWLALLTSLLGLAAILSLRRARNGTRLTAMLLILGLLPPLCAILVSLTVTPVFITRIMTPTALPILLLLAIGASDTGRFRLLALASALSLGGSMLVADVRARRGPPMQDWYGTVDWLRARFRPGDVIFAYPNEGKLPLAYALRDKGLAYPIRAIPADVPALEVRHGRHPTGTRGVSVLPRAELRAIAQEPATRAIPTIWLLRLGPSLFDPDEIFLDELHRGRRIVRHWQDGSIDIVGLARTPRSPPAPVGSRR